MTLTVSIGVVGLVLSVVPVWAADFSAELDFVTRASNSNLFAIEELQLALDRSGDSQVKTFARRLVEDHGSAEAELKAAAEGSGAAVPTTLDEEHQARLTALQGEVRPGLRQGLCRRSGRKPLQCSHPLWRLHAVGGV